MTIRRARSACMPAVQPTRSSKARAWPSRRSSRPAATSSSKKSRAKPDRRLAKGVGPSGLIPIGPVWHRGERAPLLYLATEVSTEAVTGLPPALQAFEHTNRTRTAVRKEFEMAEVTAAMVKELREQTGLGM